MWSETGGRRRERAAGEAQEVDAQARERAAVAAIGFLPVAGEQARVAGVAVAAEPRRGHARHEVPAVDDPVVWRLDQPVEGQRRHARRAEGVAGRQGVAVQRGGRQLRERAAQAVAGDVEAQVCRHAARHGGVDRGHVGDVRLGEPPVDAHVAEDARQVHEATRNAQGGVAEEELEGDTQGDPLELWLSGRTLTDISARIDGERIELTFGTDKTPALIRDSLDAATRYVASPIAFGAADE